MKIGIFSQYEVVGGSEFRCVELANGIARYTPHEAFLLCEGLIHPQVLKKVDPTVSLRLNVLKMQKRAPILYEMDAIIVVNSNSDVFADAEYWLGNTDRHDSVVDLTRIKAFVFLFNFVLDPAAKLPSLLKYVPSIGVMTANSRFFETITSMERYKEIRHLPRLMLPSPIASDSVSTYKRPSRRIRIGQHSMPWVDKFNEEISDLIAQINKLHANRISWHFMGIAEHMTCLISKHPNVTIQPAFAMPVKSFLMDVDVFLFYPSWSRSEPWSRSVAEALMSGCPVLATATRSGNRDQIVQDNNGYLCRSLSDFAKHLTQLIQQPELIRVLGRNAWLYSRFFTTEYVVRKLVEFIR